MNEPVPNPFREAGVLTGKLAEYIGELRDTVRPDGEPTDDQVRAAITDMIGDREELADRVQEFAEAHRPYGDSVEMAYGIHTALDFLFGELPEGDQR